MHVKSLVSKKEETAQTDEENKESEATKVKNVTVIIKVDDEVVYKNENVPENTELVNHTIKAKGVVNIKVFIDDVRYANEQMDMNGSNTVLDVK